MITNDNDFLGLIISCANENNDCDVMDVINKSGMSDIDCIPFIKSLTGKGLVEMISTQALHVYPQAHNVYISPKQERKDLVLKSSKSTMKVIIEIIVGVAIVVVAAYLVFHFGWNQP